MSKKIKVIEKLKNDPLMPLRHTCEHVLHTAMQELYPKLKKVMGPPIEDGFYFDFDLDEKITPTEFEKIEKRMQEIIDAKLEVYHHEVSEAEAKEIFKNNEYKLNTIDEIKDRGEMIGLYSLGKEGDTHYDLDLCAGPHVDNVSAIKAFKLLSVAGAYYKGDEKNKMLQRIYGTAFDSQEKLDNYLKMLEEAEKRDHRKLGKELELFFMHDTAPGSPYWLPKGLILLNELINFWRIEHKSRGYQEIASPLVNKKELYEISGHWSHYKDDMFVADMGENEVYGIKPMNCPNAMIVFGSKPRSYKELPLRLSDTDVLHRFERSGSVHGLLRVRMFRQDDAHIYVSEDQIEQEYINVFDIVDYFYGIFGLEFVYRLGTRPNDYMGNIEDWEKAEHYLTKILNKRVGEGNYIIEPNDGAFYGPKVDIVMKDALGREWQMGTVQLDFNQPKSFKLKYIDKDGNEKTPAAIHRVIYGSLERFIGILIEEFAGAFPVWLSPVQAVIIPIGKNHIDYANKIKESLDSENIRVEINDKDETMQAKIREAQLQKVPYMLIVGDKEVEANSVSVRLRTGENIPSSSVESIKNRIKEMITTKSLNL